MRRPLLSYQSFFSNGKLFPGSNITYSVPDPERDLDGEVKVEDQYYFSTPVMLSKHNMYYRSRSSYVSDEHAEIILKKYEKPAQ